MKRLWYEPSQQVFVLPLRLEPTGIPLTKVLAPPTDPKFRLNHRLSSHQKGIQTTIRWT